MDDVSTLLVACMASSLVRLQVEFNKIYHLAD